MSETPTKPARSSRSGFNAPGVTANEDRTLVNIEGINFVRQSGLGEKRSDLNATQHVLLEFEAERHSQNEKWGEQNHAQGGGEVPAKAIVAYTNAANGWKRINDARVEAGTIGWDGILLEEVYEALAEEDPVLRRAELVQTGAVVAAMIESLDRNELRKRAA